MTYEKSRATWNSGFRGYKHPTNGRLSEYRWREVEVKYYTIQNGKKINETTGKMLVAINPL